MEAWERIEFIIEREGMNKNSFSNAIGISNNDDYNKNIMNIVLLHELHVKR